MRIAGGAAGLTAGAARVIRAASAAVRLAALLHTLAAIALPLVTLHPAARTCLLIHHVLVSVYRSPVGSAVTVDITLPGTGGEYILL